MKGLAALPRTRGSALAHGCVRSGRGALPLPRVAAVSTRLRVLARRARRRERERLTADDLIHPRDLGTGGGAVWCLAVENTG